LKKSSEDGAQICIKIYAEIAKYAENLAATGEEIANGRRES